MDYQHKGCVGAVGETIAARERHVPASMGHLSHRVSDLESAVDTLVGRLENAGVLISAPPGSPGPIAKDGEQKPPLAHAIDELGMRIQVTKSRVMDLVNRLEA